MTQKYRTQIKKNLMASEASIKEGRPLGRLSEMDTQEVSLVDRAANQRRFLVVKNDGEQEGQMADTATKDKPDTEQAQSVEGLMIKRDSVRGRIAEVVDRTRRLLKHVEAAELSPADEGATTAIKGSVSSGVSREIRSCQALILGCVTKANIPTFQPQDFGKLELADDLKKSATRFLGDAIRRLEEVSGELGDDEVLDADQVKRLKSASNVMAGAGLVSDLSSSAIADEDRALVLESLEKNIHDLMDLRVGLQSETSGDPWTQEKVAEFVKSALNPPILFGGEEPIQDPEIVEAIKALRSIAKNPDGATVGPGIVAAAIKQVMTILAAVASRLPGQAGAQTANAKAGDNQEGESTPDETLEKLMSMVKDMENATNTQGDETQTSKVGAPMQRDRLSRLKSAIKLLKEAVVEAKSGSVSFEKFSQVGTVLNSIVSEVEARKRQLEASGQDIENNRTADPSNANAGSGVQPDTDDVGNATDPGKLAGEGVPQEFIEMLKELRDKVIELDAKGDRDAEEARKARARIEELESELERTKKVRSAPSATGDPDVEHHSTAKTEAVLWPSDMNQIESIRGDAR